MPAVSPEALTALSEEHLSPRNFVTMWAKNRTTGAIKQVGFWDGLDAVSFPAWNPQTGANESRSYEPFGQLVSVQDIAWGDDLTTKQVEINFTGMGGVFDAVRNFTVEQQRIEIHRGLFFPNGGSLKTPLLLRMAGIVDEVTVGIGAVNPSSKDSQPSGIRIVATGQLAELRRALSKNRCDEHQREVLSTDTGLRHAIRVPDWEQYWGQQKNRITTVPVNSPEPENNEGYDLGYE